VKSGKDFGYDIKQVCQGCKRTVAFTNENVIASVAFMATVAIEAMKGNQLDLFYAIKKNLSDFYTHDLIWSDFVRSLWELQEALDLSKGFSDDVITYMERNSAEIIDTIERIPGDRSSIWLKMKYDNL